MLAEQGQTASMADVAEAAGVGRATLYRYFPNRDALLRAVAETAVEELNTRITEAGLDTVTVPEGIARLSRAFVATGSKYIAFMRSEHKPMTRSEIDRQIGEPLRDLFRRGCADGTLRNDLTSDALLAI